MILHHWNEAKTLAMREDLPMLIRLKVPTLIRHMQAEHDSDKRDTLFKRFCTDHHIRHPILASTFKPAPAPEHRLSLDNLWPYIPAQTPACVVIRGSATAIIIGAHSHGKHCMRLTATQASYVENPLIGIMHQGEAWSLSRIIDREGIPTAILIQGDTCIYVALDKLTLT